MCHCGVGVCLCVHVCVCVCVCVCVYAPLGCVCSAVMSASKEQGRSLCCVVKD